MSFERLIPDTPEWQAYYANHIHRYMFAADQLKRRTPGKVLDAACGVGYGADWLAKDVRTHVTAIDRDSQALNVAAQRFANDNVTFCQDDCHTLEETRKHAPFDAIVSFETVEHLPRPTHFLRQCCEVIKPGGTLVVSTPNASARTGLQAEWQYHEKEYTAREFTELLADCGFHNVQLYGQQLTELGKLREQMRHEINELRSNPFNRLGVWVQRRLRGFSGPRPALPEAISDFEITPIKSASQSDERGDSGPFVLIGVAST